MRYVWNRSKRLSNLEKHGVLFDEAVEIFDDEHKVIESDERFDYGEERLVILGKVRGRVHVVVYVNKGSNIVRIISARKANKREVRRYEQG